MTENSTVRVAVRIRPLVASEIQRGCQNLINAIPENNQLHIIGPDKSFTFNHVFPTNTNHDEFYDTAVKNMIPNIFKGYNVTILAYGQTGSGKTYTMGTNYTGEGVMGVIPRAIHDIFNTINKNNDWTFRVSISFMELYNEQLYDLLAPDKQRKDCIVDIREDNKEIKIVGITEIEVKTADETLQMLVKGSQGRATGSTAMNFQSSRSHAIFTILIHQQKSDDPSSATSAKFHLVDLAGSERSKKTGATGERFKEGVNINRGLLALGNVISQLGENDGHTFIPYRDSKLTRLLQDSLGGNSMTLMVACVSPADYNLDETLSTLRYADRAKKIKNKPIVNQDPKTAEINRLQTMVRELKMALLGQGSVFSCPPEHSELAEKNRELHKKLRQLMEKFNTSLINTMCMNERGELADNAKEQLYITDGDLDHSNEILNNTTDLDEEHAVHTLRQAERESEVHSINRALALKEELVLQLLNNASEFSEQIKEIQDMENEIKNLQVEKEQLTKALETVHANNASAKLAETRRKKLMELEKKITDLTKKCVEQSRIIKSKEKSDSQVKNLTSEIQSLKQTRVKLVREMRKEAEKFSQYKIKREREIHKLKDQDRKRQNQIVRMQTQHNKQQIVSKRKMEEACAVIKRLKETMEKQRQAQMRRNKSKTSTEEIKTSVSQGMAMILNTTDAKYSLEKLMKDRTVLTQNLCALKQLYSNNPSEQIKDQIKDSEDYIELRNVQISELQQKIIEADEENRKNAPWKNVQTLGDAKIVIEALTEGFIECGNKFNMKSREYDELIEKYDETLMTLRKNELKEMAKQQRDNNSEIPQIYISNENENYRDDEIAKLRRELEEANLRLAMQQSKKAKNSRVTQLMIDEELAPSDFTDDSFNFEDDINKDPDWEKTPLHKRPRTRFSKQINTSDEKIATKHSSGGDIKCACRTKCTSGICSCRKNSEICGENCRCNPLICVNRDKIDTSSPYFSVNQDDDILSKRPRFSSEDV
ncbi:hypothetical protein PV327_005615 [Microctonus hyperodae]|uniref:Kinesin-like protein n=1 Tax=Microctonus hyperodae TaxID=165561 RepID=A0AA39G1Q4_MICHY|nr:hypothetical protein PV327_005615 [Microctonus hyperodae]